MCSFFTHKEMSHNLKKGNVLSLPPAKLTYYGTNLSALPEIPNLEQLT